MAIQLSTKITHKVLSIFTSKSFVVLCNTHNITVQINQGFISFFDENSTLISNAPLKTNTAFFIAKQIETQDITKYIEKYKKIIKPAIEKASDYIAKIVTEKKKPQMEAPEACNYTETQGTVFSDDNANPPVELENLTKLGSNVAGTSPNSIYWGIAIHPQLKLAVRITSSLVVSLRVANDSQLDLAKLFKMNKGSNYESVHLKCNSLEDVIKLIGALYAIIRNKYPDTQILNIDLILKKIPMD